MAYRGGGDRGRGGGVRGRGGGDRGRGGAEQYAGALEPPMGGRGGAEQYADALGPPMGGRGGAEQYAGALGPPMGGRGGFMWPPPSALTTRPATPATAIYRDPVARRPHVVPYENSPVYRTPASPPYASPSRAAVPFKPPRDVGALSPAASPFLPASAVRALCPSAVPFHPDLVSAPPHAPFTPAPTPWTETVLAPPTAADVEASQPAPEKAPMVDIAPFPNMLYNPARPGVGTKETNVYYFMLEREGTEGEEEAKQAYKSATEQLDDAAELKASSALETLKRQLQARMQYAIFVQDTAKEMAKEVQSGETKQTAEDLDEFLNKVRKGEHLSSENVGFAKLFDDELTLEKMTREGLENMCKYMGIRPCGTDHYLRTMLRKKLFDIKNDDKMIQMEGVESISEDLQHTCHERGHFGPRSTEEMRQKISFHPRKRPLGVKLSDDGSLPFESEVGKNDKESRSSHVKRVPMNILITTLVGTLTVHVQMGACCSCLKLAIETKIGVSIDNFTLRFGGKVIDYNETLQFHGINNLSVLHMDPKMRGGAADNQNNSEEPERRMSKRIRRCCYDTEAKGKLRRVMCVPSTKLVDFVGDSSKFFVVTTIPHLHIEGLTENVDEINSAGLTLGKSLVDVFVQAWRRRLGWRGLVTLDHFRVVNGQAVCLLEPTGPLDESGIRLDGSQCSRFIQTIFKTREKIFLHMDDLLHTLNNMVILRSSYLTLGESCSYLTTHYAWKTAPERAAATANLMYFCHDLSHLPKSDFIKTCNIINEVEWSDKSGNLRTNYLFEPVIQFSKDELKHDYPGGGFGIFQFTRNFNTHSKLVVWNKRDLVVGLLMGHVMLRIIRSLLRAGYCIERCLS